MMQKQTDYDVIVIGGGPAGATVAALVAQKGYRVRVCEREQFPRFKIGESLMPGTYSTLKRLGVLDEMRKSCFPKKYSVQFYSKSGQASAPFYFSDNDSGESSQTWQVLRSEFDKLLLENAAKKGAEVSYGLNVTDVIFEDGRATGVVLRRPDKTFSEIRANVLVDASGQSALIARRLKISRTEPELKKGAIFTHFEGAQRDDGIDAGATLIFHTANQDSWFWYIPLPDNVASIGVVGDIDYLLTNREGEAQQIFEEELDICPALKARLNNSEQLFPVKTTKDFSYRASQIAGDGWVLVGDAFGFLDPIYSSGVFLALKSGELAADCIVEALREGDLSGKQLGKFGPDFVKGMEAIRKLVYAFYTKGFSFAKFLKRHPERAQEIIDILIGNVFDRPINGLFASMEEMCELPEDFKLATNGHHD